MAPDADEELIDHTGRLLKIMAEAGGMGRTWEHYPPIGVVLEAYAGHLARQAPSLTRYLTAAHIADHLVQADPKRLGAAAGNRQDLLEKYLAVLRRADWSGAAREGLDPDGDFFAWFTETIAKRLRLPGFP